MRFIAAIALFVLFQSARAGEYRTPLSGEALTTEIFGRKIHVEARDRSNLNAWDVGLSYITPGVSQFTLMPVASLYFWRRPTDDSLFRAVVVGLYNDIVWANAFKSIPGPEWLLTLDNFVIPLPHSVYTDGQRQDLEEVTNGYFRPGIGIGHRRNLRADKNVPQQTDNMEEVNINIEPSYNFFIKGERAAEDFTTPKNHIEMRLHGRYRRDMLLRNLLELPHKGYAWGADAAYSYRTRWNQWGRARNQTSDQTQDYIFATAYAWGVGEVPGLKSERHRVIGSWHLGAGRDLDRWSRFQLGGGPVGEEYYALSRPVLPGAFIQEFLASRYSITTLEYRYEPIFFVYLSGRFSLSYLDRERFIEGGKIRRNDRLASAGARLTSGFVFDTRLQIDYNYNFNVLRPIEGQRDSGIGGHEITAHISGMF